MTDYSQLSDFEINKRVASVLGYASQGVGWVDGLDGTYNYIAKTKDGHREVLPEYCKSPAYSWEIIVKHKINIKFDSHGTKKWCKAQAPTGHEYTSLADRPLRAAMIVFLMMRESSARIDDVNIGWIEKIMPGNAE
ncbi:phage protein NinX family protein [Serratia proteamaculans]|uniref:phage protein NinX family protein n=1 Tax=Serratia proteamaculans TaxID=28151 RepID=UPI0039BE4EBF